MVPNSFCRLSWAEVTAQDGSCEFAKQPSVSCPCGPLTYAGVIRTGKSRVALTSNGLADVHVSTPVSLLEQLSRIELFPTALNVILLRK